MKRNQLLDEISIVRAVARMTHEIIERNRGVEDICLMGVKSRGVPLAERINANIEKFEGVKVPIGYLDVTRHRDDMTIEEKEIRATECYFPCEMRDKTVIIVDDVLYTGRTARAAMECVFAHTRPKALQLAVLIDRGHREVPIRPDYVGKNVHTSRHEDIAVLLGDADGQNAVYISDETK